MKRTFAFLVLVCVVLMLSACKPATSPETPRAVARRTVIVLAVATQAVRDTCYEVATGLVENGSVVSVTPNGPAGSGTIPDDGFYLVGRDAAATAIRALQPGDPVTLSYALADDVAKTMKFALGDGGTIVSGGQVVGGLDTSIAPRTALGFKDGGHTLVLATWDGPGGTGKGGVGIDKEARDLAAMGVQTAVNLDGGGSTTMVARALGEDDATVRNVPSDGGERSDPNGVGVFVAKGDGKLHQLLIKPAPGAAFSACHGTSTYGHATRPPK